MDTRLLLPRQYRLAMHTISFEATLVEVGHSGILPSLCLPCKTTTLVRSSHLACKEKSFAGRLKDHRPTSSGFMSTLKNKIRFGVVVDWSSRQWSTIYGQLSLIHSSTSTNKPKVLVFLPECKSRVRLLL